jgi:hypothetical protein
LSARSKFEHLQDELPFWPLVTTVRPQSVLDRQLFLKQGALAVLEALPINGAIEECVNESGLACLESAQLRLEATSSVLIARPTVAFNVFEVSC